jgi:hypothetical protein
MQSQKSKENTLLASFLYNIVDVPYRFMLIYKPTKLEQKHKPVTLDSATHKLLQRSFHSLHNTYKGRNKIS